MISAPVKVDVPKIAIIGKPNVGKSTLYNRLIGKRKAITDPTPGVTRDALEAPFTLGEKSFVLIDTGGYTTGEGGYNRIVASNTIRVADDADLILLTVDVNDVDGNDLMFIEHVRIFSEKIILVVNKVDNDKREQSAWNMYSLGFKRVVSVSAEHGTNIEQLKEEIDAFFKDVISVPREPEKKESLLRITILGKPNTGKSTLINKLLGEEKSIVSEVPGTTRDVIEGRFYYKEQLFHVIDTAGIRKKTKVTDSVEYYSVNRAIESITNSDVALLLIDSIQDISDQDKKIAALVENHGKGIILVLSKWDLLPNIPNRLNAVKDRIRFLFPVLSFAPILPISAHSGFGIEKLLVQTIAIFRQLNTRIDTSRLNRSLKSWMDHFSVKAGGRPIKAHYSAQISVNPVKFVCFLNNRKGFKKEYENYIKNKIREDFGLNNIPVSIEFRLSEK